MVSLALIVNNLGLELTGFNGKTTGFYGYLDKHMINLQIHFCPTAERVWMGLSDANGDDNWVWNSGRKLSTMSSHWGYAEPSNIYGSDDEDCGAMNTMPDDPYARHYLNDIPCSYPNHFICQIFN